MRYALLLALASCGTEYVPPDAPPPEHTCTASLTCDTIVYEDRVTLCASQPEVDAWLGDWLATCFFIAEQSGCLTWTCRDECVPRPAAGECRNSESTLDAGAR